MPASYASVSASLLAPSSASSSSSGGGGGGSGKGEAEAEAGRLVFDAQLHSVDGRRVAVGRDFDAAGRLIAKRKGRREKTVTAAGKEAEDEEEDEDEEDEEEREEESEGDSEGDSEGGSVLVLDDDVAEALQSRLFFGETAGGTARGAGPEWRVEAVKATQRRSKPPRPLTTSQLQQEANRRLRFGATETMRTAQGLYERGYITYMRTDSAALSSAAFEAARRRVSEAFGADFLAADGSADQKQQKPPNAKEAEKRKHSSSSSSSRRQQMFAQEAHEAIRPAIQGARATSDGSSSGSGGEDCFPTPDEVAATPGDARRRALYELIYRRTSSVMRPPSSTPRRSPSPRPSRRPPPLPSSSFRPYPRLPSRLRADRCVSGLSPRIRLQ